MERPTPQVTRLDVAQALLTATSVGRLRQQARTNLKWRSVYRGFRPDSLSRLSLTRGAPLFAADPVLLSDLCTVFLDELDVEPDADVRSRFSVAAARPDLDSQLQNVLRSLSETELWDLPKGQDFAPASQERPEPQSPDASPPGSI